MTNWYDVGRATWDVRLCYNVGMEDAYLNLNDKAKLVDFLSEWSGLASKDTKAKAEAMVRDYDDGKVEDVVPLMLLAKAMAIEIWPIRFALNRFFEEEGALIELDKVEKSVRKSTAHLIERFRNNSGCKSLSELLAHDDFDMSFRDEERSEIEQMRHHIREDYWTAHAKNLSKLVEEGKELMETFQDKMESLRLIAEGLPALLQEELYAKVNRFEDQCFYKGQSISSEILDQELAYYKEQEALPIE